MLHVRVSLCRPTPSINLFRKFREQNPSKLLHVGLIHINFNVIDYYGRLHISFGYCRKQIADVTECSVQWESQF